MSIEYYPITMKIWSTPAKEFCGWQLTDGVYTLTKCNIPTLAARSGFTNIFSDAVELITGELIRHKILPALFFGYSYLKDDEREFTDKYIESLLLEEEFIDLQKEHKIHTAAKMLTIKALQGKRATKEDIEWLK